MIILLKAKNIINIINIQIKSYKNTLPENKNYVWKNKHLFIYDKNIILPLKFFAHVLILYIYYNIE